MLGAIKRHSQRQRLGEALLADVLRPAEDQMTTGKQRGNQPLLLCLRQPQPCRKRCLIHPPGRTIWTWFGGPAPIKLAIQPLFLSWLLGFAGELYDADAPTAKQRDQ